MISRFTKPAIIVLAIYWLWHALFVVAATGTFDPRGYVSGTFYLENFLSLYVPPALIALLIYLRHRKTNASD